jgi:hypothetical protein
MKFLHAGVSDRNLGNDDPRLCRRGCMAYQPKDQANVSDTFELKAAS